MYGLSCNDLKYNSDFTAESIAYAVATAARNKNKKVNTDVNNDTPTQCENSFDTLFQQYMDNQSNLMRNSMQNYIMKGLSASAGCKNSDFSDFSAVKNISYPKGIINSLIEKIAKQEGVNPKLVKAIAWHESRFKSNVTSKCGAMGVMQLMPATAKQFGCKNGYDPEQNIRAGCKLLNYLVKKYNGNTSEIAKVYSSGTKGNVGSVTLAYMKYLVEAVGDNVNVNYTA